jgi:hypothetical protein
MEQHTHHWKRSTRKHGHPGRFFVECSCGLTRQATLERGYLHVFNTGREQGGRTRIVSYRLKAWQAQKLGELGITFVQFVDGAFEAVRKPPTV